MGKEDIAVSRLLERKPVFADLINGFLYGGRQVVKAEELEQLSSRSGVILDAAVTGQRGRGQKEGGRSPVIGRVGDIRMKAKTGMYSVIFAGEIQTGIHYAMPVRTMLYDALEYVKQVQDLEKEHREKKDLAGSDEFLSGISRKDRLLPVVNIVFYLGDDWDGSRNIHELLDVDWGSREAKELRPFISDYHINLISARAIKYPENYKTCLQQIFSMIKCGKEGKEKLYDYIRNHREELDRMDRVEEQAALILLGEQGKLKELISEKQRGEKEEVRMRPILTELIEYMEAKGEARGEERGEMRGEARERDRMMKMNRILLQEKRYDELERASSDEDYLNKLCQELGI